MSDWTYEFADAIHALTGGRPEEIIADGRPHRFATSARRRDDAGWYVAFGDGIPAGAYGCYRAGVKETWSAKHEREFSAEEKRAFRERMQAAQLAREADQKAKRGAAAARAQAIWDGAAVCSSHPYTDRKGVKPHGLRCGRWEIVDEDTGEVRLISDQALLVPIRDVEKQLCSLQAIFPRAVMGGRDKDYLKHGEKAGGFFSIGKPQTREVGGEARPVLLVCEGYATGASLHECTGHAVAVAFDSGNLLPVAASLRRKYPGAVLVLAADNDQWTTAPVENPGVTAARAAASAVGGVLAVPPFGPEDGRPGDGGKVKGPTDYNDLHQTRGAEAVRVSIEQAISKATDRTAGWPEPTPLPTELPPVHAFHEDLLPDVLRPWAMDIAERMQCPADFIAVGALVALSSLVGARVLVQPKARDEWRVTPNLWGCVVAPPGAMKSPALNEVMRPLHKLESDLREDWERQFQDWQVETKARELRQKEDEKQAAKKIAESRNADVSRLLRPEEESPEPVMRRLIVNDTTVEALGEVMRGNSWGLLAYRDEIYGLLRSMDREGQEGARSFYLTAFDGNTPYTFDRIGRGLNIRIDRLCLSMLGGIQPGRISEYVRAATAGGGGDDGLIQRFQLAVWPDMPAQWRNVDRLPSPGSRDAAYAVYERLASIPEPEGDAPVWRLDPAAQEVFNEWRATYLEPHVRSEELHPAMAAHLSKYRKLVPALALLFALIDSPNQEQTIPEACLLRALAWAEYLESHANRIYSAAVTPELSAAVTLLRKIKSRALASTFTARDVYLKGWGGLNTPEMARKAANTLADFDWLRRDVVTTPGRPGEVFYVNPRAVEAL